MPAAEEAAVRRQRGRVRRFQHQVPRRVDERGFLLRVAAPQHEYDRLGVGVDLRDDPVGELLPAALAVRGGSAHFDREHAVQEKNALLRPMLEEPVLRGLNAEVAFQLLENVDQARRRLDTRLH